VIIELFACFLTLCRLCVDAASEMVLTYFPKLKQLQVYDCRNGKEIIKQEAYHQDFYLRVLVFQNLQLVYSEAPQEGVFVAKMWDLKQPQNTARDLFTIKKGGDFDLAAMNDTLVNINVKCRVKYIPKIALATRLGVFIVDTNG
jgi:hypothetical protein